MDLQARLSLLANHPFSVVFWSSLIEAAGIPFPSRVILILTPAFLATGTDLVRLIIVATIGALLDDHVPFIAVGWPALGCLVCIARSPSDPPTASKKFWNTSDASALAPWS